MINLAEYTPEILETHAKGLWGEYQRLLSLSDKHLDHSGKPDKVFWKISQLSQIYLDQWAEVCQHLNKAIR